MKIFILLTLIILTSCGQMTDPFDRKDMEPTDPRQFTTSDPVFDSIRNQFYDDYYHYKNGNLPRETIINFGHTKIDNRNIIGLCYRWSNGVNEIILNKTWYTAQSDMNKKILIYHELGHCALNLGHNEEKFEYTVNRVQPDGNLLTYKKTVPLSIMNPYHIGTNANIDNIEAYEKRLFTRDDSSIRQYWNEIKDLMDEISDNFYE